MVDYRLMNLVVSFFVLAAYSERSIYVNIYLEIFGYIGTALVLVSMMMTTVKWLRLFNMSGAVISMIYAILVRTWPVAVLNLGIIVIHIVKLWHLHRGEKRKGAVI